jgi:hypothetical protein
VIAFNTAEGWSLDVSEDIADEVLERAFDKDDKQVGPHDGRESAWLE